MKNMSYDGAVVVPYDDVSKPIVQYSRSKSFGPCQSKQKKAVSVMDWMNKFGRKAEQCTQDIREHGEKLLKASQCCLSTSGGPIAGLLFISTEKVAFHSDKPLTLSSPQGDILRIPYKVDRRYNHYCDQMQMVVNSFDSVKVLIPTRKIKSVSPSENVHDPKQKYMQIVTEDDFEFWFLGFVTEDPQRILR